MRNISIWLIIALSLNITSAVSSYGMYYNIPFGFHVAIVVCLISVLFKNTINVNVYDQNRVK
jgi:hypothetical protein